MEPIVKAAFNLNQAVRELPPFAQAEVYDFVLFLQHKYAETKEPVMREDAAYWTAMSEAALHKVWHNEEDDSYHELLKR